MSDPEKHGATWLESVYVGELVFEHYDARLDILGAIHRRSPALYVACLYGKVKDPGLDFAHWARIRPEAVFDDLEEAKEHIVGRMNDLNRD